MQFERISSLGNCLTFFTEKRSRVCVYTWCVQSRPSRDVDSDRPRLRTTRRIVICKHLQDIYLKNKIEREREGGRAKREKENLKCGGLALKIDESSFLAVGRRGNFRYALPLEIKPVTHVAPFDVGVSSITTMADQAFSALSPRLAVISRRRSRAKARSLAAVSE